MTAARLVVDVIGSPAPQGSKRHVGRGVMIESSKAVGPWRDSVAWQTRAAMPGIYIPPAAAQVVVEFTLPRPASVSVKRRPRPNVKPDIDKLARSTLDALVTAGALTDDATVVELIVRKWYAAPGTTTGAVITIRDLIPDRSTQQ